MKTLKKISILALLVILTLGVVFVPRLISGQRENNILNKTVYRNYKAANRPKLTSEEVARYYCNGEIGIIDNPLSVNNDNSDVETVRADVIDLIEMLFGEGDFVYDFFKENMANGNISYWRNSSLVKINNQPIALKFVNCGIKRENVVFEIHYEEKTKTIVNVITYVHINIFNNIEDMEYYTENVNMRINSYFDEQLCLSSDEYSTSVKYPLATEVEENKQGEYIIIQGKLVQLGEKVIDK